MGHGIGRTLVGELLHKLDYRLQANRRSPEPPQERNRPAGNRGGKENVKTSTLILGHRHLSEPAEL
jgi:hypothetical protein